MGFVEVNPRPVQRPARPILEPTPASPQATAPQALATDDEAKPRASAEPSIADRMAASLGASNDSRPAAHGKNTERAAQTSPAKSRVTVARQISSQESRARLRNSIMQVSDYREPEPRPLESRVEAQPATQPDDNPPIPADSDPFGSADQGLPFETPPTPPADSALQPTVPSTEPTDAAPLPEPSDDLSPPTEPAEEMYRDQPIPPPREDNFFDSPGDLSDPGLATDPGGVGCTDMKGQCTRALAELQKRDITTIMVGLDIQGVEGTDYPCDCKIGRDFETPAYQGRNFQPTLFTWKAAGTCHKPLYFQDVPLERYGHSWNPFIQPFVSGAHFFASVPLLPYKMGLRPPGECVYTLGYYRPGNCAPYMLEPIPLSLRGALFEGLGATGFAFWFWPPN